MKIFCLMLLLSPTAGARVSLSLPFSHPLSSRIPFLLSPCMLCQLIPPGYIPSSSVLLLITFLLYPLLSKLPLLFMLLIGRLLTRVKLSPAAPRCPSWFSAHLGVRHSASERVSFKGTGMELGFQGFKSFCWFFFFLLFFQFSNLKEITCFDQKAANSNY